MINPPLRGYTPIDVDAIPTRRLVSLVAM